MITNIKSKDELQNLANVLKNLTSSFTNETSSVIGVLGEKEDFDGIVISNAAMSIQKNLRVVSSEMEVLSTKITNYAMDIKNLDTYNLNFSNDFKSNDEPKKDEETLFLFNN